MSSIDVDEQWISEKKFCGRSNHGLRVSFRLASDYQPELILIRNSDQSSPKSIWMNIDEAKALVKVLVKRYPLEMLGDV